MDPKMFSKIDWKTLQSDLTMMIPEIKKRVSEILAKNPTVGVGSADSTGPNGGFGMIDFWAVSMKGVNNRAVIVECGGARYVNPNEREIDRIRVCVEELEQSFPKYEFVLKIMDKGRLIYTIKPREIPLLKDPRKRPMLAKQLNKQGLKSRLEQVLKEHPGLEKSWSDDHPTIAKHMNISTEQLQKLLR